MNFKSLCQQLAGRTVYLIHEADRESEARDFAEKLKQAGVKPLVAADYRKYGKEAVNAAIKAAECSLVVAFDDDTVNWAVKRGIPFHEVERIKTPEWFSDQGKMDVDTPTCLAIHLGSEIKQA